MKRFFSITAVVMLLVVLVMGSCDEEKINNSKHFDYLKNNNLELYNKINSVVEQYDGDANKLRKEIIKTEDCSKFHQNYEKLSPSEKAELWKDKLIFVLRTSDLSKKQYELLLDAFYFIEPDIFIDGSKKNKYAKEKFAPFWEKKSLLYFSQKDIMNVVVSLNDYSICKEVSKDYQPPRLCTCSKRSFSFGCHDTGCDETSSGCGWFGIYRCDGNRL